MGKRGLRIYDIANIDDKDISEKMTTAPVSPLGQRFYVPTKYAMAVATPTTLGVDPAALAPERKRRTIRAFALRISLRRRQIRRPRHRWRSELEKQKPGCRHVARWQPVNNFLKRALAFNPEGKLNGARRITIAGVYAYILCDRGLVVVDLDNPLEPKITAEIGERISSKTRAASPYSFAMRLLSMRKA